MKIKIISVALLAVLSTRSRGCFGIMWEALCWICNPARAIIRICNPHTYTIYHDYELADYKSL